MKTNISKPRINKTPDVSIVIPIYNEYGNISELFSRIKQVMGQSNKSWETIFVDDGSIDDSLVLLKKIAGQFKNVVIIELLKNYGQHPAIFAGFENAKGKYIITIDADLQNPPEEIPKILQKLDEGFDVVGTIRKMRKDNILRKFASFAINYFVRKFVGINVKDSGCMLRGYTQTVVRNMLETEEFSTFIPVLACNYAKKINEIEVTHSDRSKGQSKYSIFKLMSLQFDLITSFSNLPLRILIYIGFATSFASIIFASYLLIRRLVLGAEVEGVFTLFAILFFFVGFQIFLFGLVGEYISRIYSEVRKRPRYLIKEIFRGSNR